MDTLAILLCLSLWISLTEQKPSYLITAPKIIRVSVKESVTVQVFEAESSLDGSIYFFNQNNLKKCSEKYSLQLNHANNFTQVLFVQVSPEYVERRKSRGRMSYVRLVAEIPALFTNQKKVNLQLRPKPYFNFIETDKPIYTPRETVRFRTVTLDHAMKVTGCKSPLRLMKEGKKVVEVVSEVHGSDNVCRGEIQFTPLTVGDYEIQAYSTQLYSEFNGHRKFRVEEPGEFSCTYLYSLLPVGQVSINRQ
ncbi:complement C5-like [Amblyraja radiata]|uniref:complement C5-like n=1 Tax=Amblyraja radiata TaxID=386614 RepID=UPI001402DBC4|nr:complement C5-like [Amblyraja radiata]